MVDFGELFQAVFYAKIKEKEPQKMVVHDFQTSSLLENHAAKKYISIFLPTFG